MYDFGHSHPWETSTEMGEENTCTCWARLRAPLMWPYPSSLPPDCSIVRQATVERGKDDGRKVRVGTVKRLQQSSDLELP
ncbi:hypothetical protein P7K49_017332 [Saguinus oedipus]|uniref:Uncharacterized protein n=1 Tax=Saguinus oedipus TaxID=9490 RepID=A0ABQ9V2W5_SAGOE|nr:hypothetical protein P7K49_017332 [Saguinus oedipus]